MGNSSINKVAVGNQDILNLGLDPNAVLYTRGALSRLCLSSLLLDHRLLFYLLASCRCRGGTSGHGLAVALAVVHSW